MLKQHEPLCLTISNLKLAVSAQRRSSEGCSIAPVIVTWFQCCTHTHDCERGHLSLELAALTARVLQLKQQEMRKQ